MGPPEGDERSWLQSLPFFKKISGARSELFRPIAGNLPAVLGKSPAHLTDLVEKTLQWKPAARMPAASASQHKFVTPPPMSVCVNVAQGKTGLGSIVRESVDEDVLAYLQGCPTWAALVAECMESNFAANQCVSEKEAKLGLKREFVGYVDASNPPKCPSLNGDPVEVIHSNRLSFFVCAFKRNAKQWLHQLTLRIRAAIKREGLPDEYLMSNGVPFLEEELADNALMYAPTQVLLCSAREDGWHTDGGSSLLHAALTLFGARRVDVQCGEHGCISLHQKPGSFYMGNLCALNHNVVHEEHPTGTYGDEQYGDRRVQIAVMLRNDVSRNARGRKMNATPGPAELFRIVNGETAKHLAEQPLHLPDLAAVLAECTAAQ